MVGSVQNISSVCVHGSLTCHRHQSTIMMLRKHETSKNRWSVDVVLQKH